MDKAALNGALLHTTPILSANTSTHQVPPPQKWHCVMGLQVWRETQRFRQSSFLFAGLMSVNFACRPFITAVTSDKVNVDGYGPSNLVTSTSFLCHCKGFLVENFVRSPTNITFEFAINIEIEKIVLHGVVGSQRSCGYEIFSFCQAKNGSALTTLDEMTVGDINSQLDSKIDDKVFASIGKFNKLEAETFTFRNVRFKPRRPFFDLPRMTERPFDGSKHVQAEFRVRNARNLTHVSHLIIRVNRVVPGCVAAVRWVEIWGQPALTTTPEVINKVIQIHRALNKSDDSRHLTRASDADSRGNRSRNTDSRHDIDETKVKIPAEFLDAITCEVMMIPVLLPSGHNVDQMTLERHNREQASWGRVPNDPFTGKSFTDSSKPVHNAALKARIDQFVLKYGEEVQVKSRTVGSRPERQPVAVSSLVSDQNPAATCRTTEASATVPSQSASCLPGKQEQTFRAAPKRKLPLETRTSKKQNTIQEPIPVIDLTNDDNSSKAVVKWDRGRSDHEHELTSSLDAALENALCSFPAFASSSPAEKPSQICASRNTEPSGSNVYQLPCLHKMCRKCLTSELSPVKKCPRCETSYSSNSVVKVHVQNL